MNNTIRRMLKIILFASLLLMSSCDRDSTTKVSAYGKGDILRPYDEKQLILGRKVFVLNCALCHGDMAEGADNWRTKDSDGHFPPPPLNGYGHAWHHATDSLRKMIKQGSPKGTGKMPSWGDKLSDQEIDASIAWFQSLWPDQVYDVWYKRGHL